jgi:CubicO group peptidase (beta-lactamase class C family)
VVTDTVTKPLGLADTGFVARDPARLAVAYVNAQPVPTRMTENMEVSLGATAVRFAPSRATDKTAFPSGGAGMVGTAGDVLTFLETLRTGGAPILEPATVATMMKDQVGVQGATQGPGWGFGYGWAVLDDPAAAKTPQGAGTIQWGGVYGHSWFVDPKNRLTVVALTNTAFEGMNGAFTTQLRDAVYGR